MTFCPTREGRKRKAKKNEKHYGTTILWIRRRSKVVCRDVQKQTPMILSIRVFMSLYKRYQKYTRFNAIRIYKTRK